MDRLLRAMRGVRSVPGGVSGASDAGHAPYGEGGLTPRRPTRATSGIARRPCSGRDVGAVAGRHRESAAADHPRRQSGSCISRMSLNAWIPALASRMSMPPSASAMPPPAEARAGPGSRARWASSAARWPRPGHPSPPARRRSRERSRRGYWPGRRCRSRPHPRRRTPGLPRRPGRSRAQLLSPRPPCRLGGTNTRSCTRSFRLRGKDAERDLAATVASGRGPLGRARTDTPAVCSRHNVRQLRRRHTPCRHRGLTLSSPPTRAAARRGVGSMFHPVSLWRLAAALRMVLLATILRAVPPATRRNHARAPSSPKLRELRNRAACARRVRGTGREIDEGGC